MVLLIFFGISKITGSRDVAGLYRAMRILRGCPTGYSFLLSNINKLIVNGNPRISVWKLHLLPVERKTRS
jgi:hypothetical protein